MRRQRARRWWWTFAVVLALVTPEIVMGQRDVHSGRRHLNLYAAPVAASRYVEQYPQLKTIADVPQAIWLGPTWTSDVYNTVLDHMVKAAGKTVQLAVYGIPNRDNGGHSAGGSADAADYYGWVGAAGAAIGNGHAIVVLEPDALGLSRDLADPAARAARKQMIATAVVILKKQPHAAVYIDASMWVDVSENAELLTEAGVARADGFALNTSLYSTTASCYAYGDALSARVNGKHYVCDTSRNGQGPLDKQWCNVAGRGLGELPQAPPDSQPLADALLWVKHPGESDGPCNGGPGAGQFWPQYALDLIAHTAPGTLDH
jgi:endoglucanase